MKLIIIVTIFIGCIIISCNNEKNSRFDFEADLYNYDYNQLNGKDFGFFRNSIVQDSISINYNGDDGVSGVVIYYNKKAMIMVYLKQNERLNLYDEYNYEKVKMLKIIGIKVFNGMKPDDLIKSYNFLRKE